jgi:hypothetical protein
MTATGGAAAASILGVARGEHSARGGVPDRQDDLGLTVRISALAERRKLGCIGDLTAGSLGTLLGGVTNRTRPEVAVTYRGRDRPSGGVRPTPTRNYRAFTSR